MSGRATGWVLRHGPKDRAMRAVLITIADAANPDGEHAHPGIRAMVEGSGYSRATVYAAQRRLEAEGWVEVTERGGGRGMATIFRVMLGRETVQSSDPSRAETVQSSDPKGSNPRAETVQSSDRAPIGSTEPPTDNPNVDPVVAVFEAWRTSTGKTARTLLDDTRRGLIARALTRWGYPLEDVTDAVRGWEHSPHHRGENDEGRVWNDLGLLLRNAEAVERFRDLARGPRLEKRGRSPDPGAFQGHAIETDRDAPSGPVDVRETG